MVAVVEEVAGGDEAVASVVSRAAGDEDAFAFAGGLEFEDCVVSGRVRACVRAGFDGEVE